MAVDHALADQVSAARSLEGLSGFGVHGNDDRVLIGDSDCAGEVFKPGYILHRAPRLFTRIELIANHIMAGLQN